MKDINPKSRVKSLSNGLRLLHIIGKESKSNSLDQLTQKLQISKTACFRLLQTMKDHNFVEQDPSSKRYRLGSQIISLGSVAISRLNLLNIARPHMRLLRDSTGETVNLCILVGQEVVIIERFDAKFLLSSQIRVGSILPADGSACGKAILSYLSETRLREIYNFTENGTAQNFDSRQPSSIKEYQEMRYRGFSIINEEIEKGLGSIGCPILNHIGEAIAGMSISFPLSRYSIKDATKSLVPLLKEKCYKISSQLGFVVDKEY